MAEEIIADGAGDGRRRGGHRPGAGCRRGGRRAGRRQPGRRRAARGLGGEQAGRGRLDRAASRASRPAVVELVDSERPPLPGRPPRRRLDRPAAADQRRRARQPAHPSRATKCRRPTGSSCAARRPRPTCGGCASGVELEDGPTAPAEVRRLGEREIEIVLREGRNRQVRRMVEAVGNGVVALRRVRFGPLELGGLPRGRGAPALRGGGRAALGRCRTVSRARANSDSSRCAARSRPTPTRPTRSSPRPRS